VNVRVDPAIREPNGDVYRRRNFGFWFSCTYELDEKSAAEIPDSADDPEIARRKKTAPSECAARWRFRSIAR